MPNDSVKKTFGVALTVCLACSVLVSAAVVLLGPRQAENKRLDRMRNILAAGGIAADPSGRSAGDVRAEIVRLDSGLVVPESARDLRLSPERFDIKSASDSPVFGEPVPAERDLAGIKRKPKWMPVYRITGGEGAGGVILPVYGKGLWSTLYGYLALDADLLTVRGFTVYEHGETPGLGGEVDNPDWKRLWKGKRAFEPGGRLVIEVVKGRVTTGSPGAEARVDGLTGSTLTTRGLNNLVRFWLGSDGYGPFLARERAKGSTP